MFTPLLRRAARTPLAPPPGRAPLKGASPPDDAPSQARPTVPAFSKRTPMSCLETYATLRVFSREIAPEEIGRLLAIDGSKLRPINPGSRYRHEREHHYWAWSTQSRVLALDGLRTWARSLKSCEAKRYSSIDCASWAATSISAATGYRRDKAARGWTSPPCGHWHAWSLRSGGMCILPTQRST